MFTELPNESNQTQQKSTDNLDFFFFLTLHKRTDLHVWAGTSELILQYSWAGKYWELGIHIWHLSSVNIGRQEKRFTMEIICSFTNKTVFLCCGTLFSGHYIPISVRTRKTFTRLSLFTFYHKSHGEEKPLDTTCSSYSLTHFWPLPSSCMSFFLREN